MTREQRGAGLAEPVVVRPRFWTSERLRFPHDQEHEYLSDRVRDSVPLLRITVGLNWLFYAGFLLYDAVGPRHLQYGWIYLLVFGLGGGTSLLPLLLSLRRPDADDLLFLRFGRLAIIANTIAVLAATVLTQLWRIPWPYEWLGLQLLYDFFVVGLLFRAVMPLASWTWLAYVLASLATNIGADMLYRRMYFLGAVALLGGIVSYVRERGDRELWLQRRMLTALALSDALTGLANRRALFDRAPPLIAQARRENKPVALLSLDFDHFKQINDRLGHATGDRYLRLIARQIELTARRPVDIAARVGGEEFSLLLYDCDRESAVRLAEDLRQRVRGLALPHPASASAVATISIGVVAVDGWDEWTLDQLLSLADSSLYQAKESGRDRVVLAPPPDDVPTARAA